MANNEDLFGGGAPSPKAGKGAAALGLTDRGRLLPGLRCHALVLETDDWLDVGYHLGANPVARVISGGRILPTV